MTVATRFNLLKAGKITKEQFLYEMRRDTSVPFITPMTSFTDAIKILQNRGIIREVFEMGPAEDNLSEQSLEDPYMQGFMAGERGDDYQDCPYMQDENPEEYEMWTDGYSDASAGDDSHKQDSSLEDFYGDDYEENMEQEAPSLREQVKEFVSKAVEGGSSMDEAKEQAREYFSTEKAALNEAAKPKLGIDQVNPYELKKGTEYEMGFADTAAPSWAEASLMNIAGDFAKAQSKALKNLNKDPMFYTRLQANGGKKEKKEKVEKVAWDGYVKGKLAAEDKANVGNKKEGPKKTPGVKVMKEGIKTSVQKIREFVSKQLKQESQLVKSATTGATIDVVPDAQATQMKADLQKKGVRTVSTKV